MADACVHVMGLDREVYCANTQPALSHINIGTGQAISIGELAQVMREIVGFAGEVCFDVTKPYGAPEKLLDCARLEALGWRAGTDLRTGLRQTYGWFLANQHSLRT